MTISQAEILRYLGAAPTKGNPPDPRLLELAEECAGLLLEAAVPKSVLRRVSVGRKGEALLLEADSGGGAVALRAASRDLAAHLNGCEEALLFGATLGADVDRLIQRYTLRDMSWAVVLQACAAAFLEEECDRIADVVSGGMAGEGLYLRPRYSPGYGDFGLEHQRALLAALDCPRRIGLTSTGSGMLVPTKSVTAVIGLTSVKESCHSEKCAACSKIDCPFRRNRNQ